MAGVAAGCGSGKLIATTEDAAMGGGEAAAEGGGGGSVDAMVSMRHRSGVHAGAR